MPSWSRYLSLNGALCSTMLPLFESLRRMATTMVYKLDFSSSEGVQLTLILNAKLGEDLSHSRPGGQNLGAVDAAL
jgi:hypothetical protein